MSRGFKLFSSSVIQLNTSNKKMLPSKEYVFSLLKSGHQSIVLFGVLRLKKIIFSVNAGTTTPATLLTVTASAKKAGNML